MTYEVRLIGGEVETVDQADAYQQEGPLTTFFRTRQGRAVIDCWATRVASYRTSDVARIRLRASRHGEADNGAVEELLAPVLRSA